MPERQQLPRHEMRSGAGVHYHRAGRQIAQKLHHLLACRFLAKNLATGPVLAVQMKAVLAEIDTNQCNAVHDMASTIKHPARA